MREILKQQFVQKADVEAFSPGPPPKLQRLHISPQKCSSTYGLLSRVYNDQKSALKKKVEGNRQTHQNARVPGECSRQPQHSHVALWHIYTPSAW